jgi:hypothetical protein
LGGVAGQLLRLQLQRRLLLFPTLLVPKLALRL